MKGILTKLFIVLMTFTLSTAFAATSQAQQRFLLHFNSGDVYDTTLTGNTLTWKGIAGDDKNVTSTNHVRRVALSKSVEVYQWTEKTGAFITLTLDKKNHHVICSGRDLKNNQWLWHGTIKRLN
jgi:hypothetical protein